MNKHQKRQQTRVADALTLIVDRFGQTIEQQKAFNIAIRNCAISTQMLGKALRQEQML